MKQQQKKEIVDSRSDLEKCLEEFFKSESIVDYRCEKCGKIGNIQRQYKFMPKMPSTIVLDIKRYRQQQTRFGRAKLGKINARITFPENLNFSQWVVNQQDENITPPPSPLASEYAAKNMPTQNLKDDKIDYSKLAKLKLKSKTKTLRKKYSSPPPNPPLFNEEFEYVLKSVVVHSGGLNGGHYTCYSRRGKTKENSQWHYFTDSRFKVVTKSEVFSRPCYVLFYEKKN